MPANLEGACEGGKLLSEEKDPVIKFQEMLSVLHLEPHKAMIDWISIWPLRSYFRFLIMFS